ncbi:MAG TPA: hypothetical protein PKW35_01590 [Nannocystaceae bacterium]|nr:hypothetical protein [Nannocystaceae bacterium]
MHFSFTQIYPEAGASFNLNNSILKLLREHLDALNKHIPHLTREFRGEDYKIVFIIVATHKLPTTTTRGPNLVRGSRCVEFAVWIPYQDLDFRSRIVYVLSALTDAIEWTLRRYHTDPSGIADAIRQTANVIVSNPTRYE